MKWLGRDVLKAVPKGKPQIQISPWYSGDLNIHIKVIMNMMKIEMFHSQFLRRKAETLRRHSQNWTQQLELFRRFFQILSLDIH